MTTHGVGHAEQKDKPASWSLKLGVSSALSGTPLWREIQVKMFAPCVGRLHRSRSFWTIACTIVAAAVAGSRAIESTWIYRATGNIGSRVLEVVGVGLLLYGLSFYLAIVCFQSVEGVKFC